MPEAVPLRWVTDGVIRSLRPMRVTDGGIRCLGSMLGTDGRFGGFGRQTNAVEFSALGNA